MKSFINLISIFSFILLYSSSVQAQDVYAQTRVLKILSIELPQIKLKDLPVLELPDRPKFTPGASGERQYWLNKKDPAPYAGVLLNPEAMAFILSEYQAIQERAQITLEAQRKSDLAVLQLETAKLEVELESAEESYETKLKSREKEIERLLKTNKDLGKAVKNRKKKFLIGISSATVGIIGGFIAGAILL